MKKPLLLSSVLAFTFMWTQSSFANSGFIPNLTPIKQLVLDDKNVYEGCGPVAAAILLSPYQTENGFDVMEEMFNGYTRPTKTILNLRKTLNTNATPFTGSNGNPKESYTLPGDFKRGLQKHLKNKDLNFHVKSLNSITRWNRKTDTIKSQIDSGNPLVALIREIPTCINAKKQPSKFSWHYIVINGYDDDMEEFYVLDGYYGGTREDTARPDQFYNAHHKKTGPKKCSYTELKSTNMGLYWIEI
jgi:uncharacterized protein YvpB